MFSWVGPFPAIPHWEGLVVSCPCKILVSNTASTLSIKKSGTPVRGLRSKSRPFVIAGKLAIAIFFHDRFIPMFQFSLRVKFLTAFFRVGFNVNDIERQSFTQGQCSGLHSQHCAPCAPYDSARTHRPARARGEGVPDLEEPTGSAARRIYRATPAGIRTLAAAKLKVARVIRRAVRGRYCQLSGFRAPFPAPLG
jgi:hypothetical protein